MSVPTLAGPGLLDRVVDARGGLRAAMVLRRLMGVVVVVHLWPDVRARETPVEHFHVPWWSWLPEPSADAYRLLLCVGVACGLGMLAGVASRLCTRTAFAVVTYLVLVDMTGFAHNRGYLVWLLFGLSLLPAEPRGPHAEDTGFLWPVLLLRVVASCVYLTSGLTKLANPDWRSGLVLWDRVVRYQGSIPFGGGMHDLLTSRAFHRALAPSAIAAELFIGLGLWSRRTRLVAIWVAIVFHTSIELTASVQTFSYSAIIALLWWATPSERDRTVTASPQLQRMVGRLDWLHRFTPGGPGAPGAPTTLVERDGTLRQGRDATLTTLSRLPLLFPFVAPALAVHRLRRQRRATAAPHPSSSSSGPAIRKPS